MPAVSHEAHNGNGSEMSASAEEPNGGEADSAPPSQPAAQGRARGAGHQRETSRGMLLSVRALERVQDVVAVLIGVVLLFLAGALLASGIMDFARHASSGIPQAAQLLLDRALFVLILIEIVHTVVLSLQAHRLIAQPFVVVGLVAVIRRILLQLSSPNSPKPAELGLLIAMVAVFVAGLIAISRFEAARHEEDQI